MKITAEMKSTILEMIRELESSDDIYFSHIGVRVQEEAFELGSIDHSSHVWVHGDETDEELPGLCITVPERMCANEYFGDHVAIIGGDIVEYGEDDGEVIVSDAVVLAIIA